MATVARMARLGCEVLRSGQNARRRIEVLRRGVSRKRELGSAAKTGVSPAATGKSEKIEVENGNHPAHVARVDAGLYEAMKQALFLKILPKKSPDRR
jgi:hypothetical protein